MNSADFEQLASETERLILSGARSVGVLGLTPVAVALLSRIRAFDRAAVSVVVYDDKIEQPSMLDAPLRSWPALSSAQHDVLVVADDLRKEDLLDTAGPHIRGLPRVVIAGYAHLKFRDATYDRITRELLVPSLANGYPNTLTHLYQCLANAARLNLVGTVAEFGMFRGGTTMFLAKAVRALGQHWPVVGFDTFDGFPPRRSILDMYSHPDCTWRDVAGVEGYLHGMASVVKGDIIDTCEQLRSVNLVLSFVDTDNYSSARAVIDVVSERTLVGGAIVFDHFTGRDRFCYTLGERMAARVLLGDSRYFHLHDTGVFYRQR